MSGVPLFLSHQEPRKAERMTSSSSYGFLPKSIQIYAQITPLFARITQLFAQ